MTETACHACWHYSGLIMLLKVEGGWRQKLDPGRFQWGLELLFNQDTEQLHRRRRQKEGLKEVSTSLIGTLHDFYFKLNT